MRCAHRAILIYSTSTFAAGLRGETKMFPQHGPRRTPRTVDSILDTIGATPMVRLRRLAPAGGASVWAKLELANPGGSAKDRIALAMLRGVPSSRTVVEASSGNTAIALAQA